MGHDSQQIVVVQRIDKQLGEVKSVLTIVANQVLELHQAKMNYSLDKRRMYYTSALLSVACGLFFGWIGALFYAVVNR